MAASLRTGFNTKPLNECKCGRTFGNPRGARQHARIMNRKEPGQYRAGGDATEQAKYLAKKMVERAMMKFNPTDALDVPDPDPTNGSDADLGNDYPG